MPDTTLDYEIHIRPTKGWFRSDWEEVWHYRDLLYLLVRRDFVAKYRQTVLGPAWALIQPLLTAAVFTVIFGKIARIPTEGIPPFLFYLCGMLTWGYFSQAVQMGGNSLQGNAGILGKVYFPRIIPSFAYLISASIPFIFQLLLFLAFFSYFAALPSGSAVSLPGMRVLLFPLFLLHAAGLALGVGLLLSALTAKYRDFQQVMGFFIQLWMYATPIIYPISKVPESWRWALWLNPMAPVVEGTKYAFLHSEGFQLGPWFISIAVTMVIGLLGFSLFERIQRTFIDTV